MSYTKKETFEAVQWNSTNEEEVRTFLGGSPDVRVENHQLIFPLVRGSASASPGDWIVKGEDFGDLSAIPDAVFTEQFVEAAPPAKTAAKTAPAPHAAPHTEKAAK